MNYLITGGTGLIGSHICQKLTAGGHTVIVLGRSLDNIHRRCGSSVTAITSLDDIDRNQAIDFVINLAGAPIADARWSKRRKQLLEQSRIKFTEDLIAWIAKRQHKPTSLISGSAIGWYGDQGDTLLTEDSGFRDEFAHQLCHQWEQAALKAEQFGLRVCLVRTGLVIAKGTGFLQRMLLPFKLGLGGPLGDGKQYLSWIHLEDICNLFIFLSEKQELEGFFNGTAPEPVTNAEFSKTLAQHLHRPSFMVVPACVLKLALGEMSQLLLGGQRVVPERVRKAGFEFQYTDLQSALADVLK